MKEGMEFCWSKSRTFFSERADKSKFLALGSTDEYGNTDTVMGTLR
jgi:hypothetical protein